MGNNGRDLAYGIWPVLADSAYTQYCRATVSYVA